MKIASLLVASALLVIGCQGTPGTAGSLNQATLNTVKFRAGVITRSGEVTKLARTEVKLLPYDIVSLKETLAAKNNAGPAPEATAADTAASWRSKRLAWAAKAYVGLDTEKARAAGDRKSLSIRLDLDGEGEATLATGKWWAVASWTNPADIEGRTMVWNVPFEVTKDGQKVELSNDNKGEDTGSADPLPMYGLD